MTIQRLPHRFLLLIIAGLAFTILGFAGLQAQSDTGNISGTVFNEVTGRALQGAVVRVSGTNTVDRTDVEGRFFLSGIPTGSRQLSVYYVGLEQSTTTVNVSASQPQTVVIGLSSEVYELENFVVVPQIVGQDRAINMQKTAAGIINIISEEQFGAMLDGNIGQALQRLPGISVDEDQDGSQGSINIRGIAGEYNSVQVDGNRVPTSGSSRSFNPRNFSSEGITTIEVIKAPTPDRDGDAIGGIVNLVTRSAFQRQGREMSLKLAGILNARPDNWGSSASFEFSDIFSVGNGENNLGISFTVARYDTDRYSLNADMDWVQVDPGGDNAYLNLPTDKPVWFFESTHFEFDNRETDNYSISGSIDYRIDEQNSFYFRPSFSRFDRTGSSFETDIDLDTRFQNRDDGRKTYEFLTDSTGGGTSPENYFGGSRGSYGWVGTIDNSENELYTIATGGRHERDDSLLTYDVFISKNENVDTDSTEVNMRTDRKGDPNFLFNYEIVDIQRGDVKVDILNGLDPRDLSLMERGQLRDTSGFKTEEVFSAKIDWEKAFTGDKGVFTLKTGAKFRESDLLNDLTRDRYGFEDDFPYADILTSTGDEKLFLKTRYWQVKPEAAKALRVSRPELFELDGERRIIDTNVSDYDATESTTAGYVMGTYETGIHTYIFGLRREEVDWDNKKKDVSFLDEDNPSVDIIDQGSSYGFWLPGVHGRHALKENLVLRESYNRSYGRPRLTELSRGRSEDEDGNIRDGNPDLKPVVSDNYDIQLEYYTDKGGLFSIGYFYKDIVDFSFDRRFDFDEVGPDGTPIMVESGEFEFRQSVNGTTAVNKGVELIARQQLYFLPGAWSGLALGASATLSDSNADIPNRTDRDDLTLPGFSDKIYTATLDYAWSGFTARLDCRLRGDFIEGLGSDIESDEFFAEEYRMDAEISYRIRPGVIVYATGTNLTDHEQASYQGFPPFVEDANLAGPKYSFGMEFDF
jgi:TonB-dependent receptor